MGRSARYLGHRIRMEEIASKREQFEKSLTRSQRRAIARKRRKRGKTS